MSKIGVIPKFHANLEEISKGKWVKSTKAVINPGPSGSFDERVAASPVVVERADGFYSLYYMAQNQTGDNWGIGLAYSDDLINWKKWENNPVFIESMVKWGRKIDGPFINRLDDIFYMFYETAAFPHWLHRIQTYVYGVGLGHILNNKHIRKFGQRYLFSNIPLAVIHAHQRRIGFATSRDGRLWSDFSENPVFRPGKKSDWDSDGVFAPKVYKKDNEYLMFYSASSNGRIKSGLALSSDLKTWRRYNKNPILITGSKGEWDELCVVLTSIVRLNDCYLMFYEGEDVDNIYRIGMAFSNDLISWKKFDNNPIVNIGKRGSFDDKMVNAPHVVVYKDKLYLLYSAFNSKYEGRIGLLSLYL